MISRLERYMQNQDLEPAILQTIVINPLTTSESSEVIPSPGTHNLQASHQWF